MKLILIGVLLAIQINTICGHSLSKIKLKDRSAAEAKDGNSITIPNQKPEKMTLREIINLNDEAFGRKKSSRMATYFNDIRRPFTNGPGHQYLEHSGKTSLETDIPKAPKLETLDIEKLPNYMKRHPDGNSMVHDSGNDEDHTSTESDSASQSDERRDWNPRTRGPEQSKHSDDNYGLNLSEHNGYVWNNLFRPKYKYDVKILPYSVEDSSSEENSSSSVEDSNQSEDASNTDSNSQEDNVSDSHSHETDSQSHEDNNSDKVNITNEDTQNDTDESTSNEFDPIVSNVIDNGDDSNQLATDDKDTNVNILAVLNNIFNHIVKNEENKANDKSNVLHILHGLITNIFNNYISVTSIMNEGNTNLDSNKSNVKSSTVVNAIEPETHNTTDSIVSEQTTAIDDLNEPSTEDIYTTAETVTSYENLITEAHNGNINYILSTIKDNVFTITEADERTTTVQSIERNKDESNQREPSTSNEIVDTSTKYNIESIQTTKQPPQDHNNGLSDSEDTNIETPIVTENPEHCSNDSKETGDIYKPNYEDKSNGSIEPPNHLVSGNNDVSLPQTEKPIQGDPNTDQTTEAKLKPTKDQVTDKEKFWSFMGDLVGQYLAELMSRTSFLIKYEVESQIAERLKEQKKKDKEKEVIKVISHNVYGNALGNEKVTNIYVFNLNKYAHEVMDDVKKIINGNNGTNILTFGKDNPNESNSPKDNDVTNDEIENNVGPSNIPTSVTDFGIPIEVNSVPTNIDQPPTLVNVINDTTPTLVEVTMANYIPPTTVDQLQTTVKDITNIEPTSTVLVETTTNVVSAESTEANLAEDDTTTENTIELNKEKDIVSTTENFNTQLTTGNDNTIMENNTVMPTIQHVITFTPVKYNITENAVNIKTTESVTPDTEHTSATEEIMTITGIDEALSTNVNEPPVDELVTDIESVTGSIELTTKFKNFITTTEATNKPNVTDMTVGVAHDSTTLASESQTTTDKPGESKTSDGSEYEKSTTIKSLTTTATDFNTLTTENEETTDNPTTSHIKIQSTEGSENEQNNTEKSETNTETITLKALLRGSK